ncbi:MAG: Crp/Fnr family transcriptional regulator [Bdellovibrionales bacterium]|nr:Crp/Fnr family transcriptional regulator [Bdellovibrionales bacterium]
MGGVKQLRKGDILFREGDPSDAMFVIKKGRIAITKAKGESEIVLAELVPGEMLGEMAFFDNKPRSAGAKAAVDSEVIELPFKALYAQFKTFPEWLKAMVKTVNSHLRNANQRIKNLESTQTDSTNMFPPHMITRLTAIISLVGFKAGEKEGETSLVIPYPLLRNYCIQVFQAPTNKLDKIMEVYQSLGFMKVEDLGEGKKKISILNHKLLTDFTDWYNKYLFTEESKRVTLEEKELDVLRALVFYGKKQTPDGKGEVTVNLTEMQNNSMKDLGKVIDINMPDPLIEKKLIQDKQSGEGGIVTTKFKLEELETILPYWEIVYTLKKIPGRA